jgi:hypothetical protein
MCVSVLSDCFKKTVAQKMSARPVVKTSYMSSQMQEFAIITAQVCEVHTYFVSCDLIRLGSDCKLYNRTRNRIRN